MAFLPRLSYLNLYGDELHQTGGDLLKARLSEWERELQYLRFRIAEWKQFGSVEHPDYYPFRSFLLQKIRNHIYFELKTFSTILTACDVAVRSDDVPPLQNYADRIYAFRERISPGEITRRNHLGDWQRYSRDKDEMVDSPSQMDELFAKMRKEIGEMEQRSKEFKRMVDELVRMVHDMQETERRGGFVNGPGPGRAATARRDIPRRIPFPGRENGAGGARSRPVYTPSDDLVPPRPILALADSRARLPPPLPAAVSGSPRPPTSDSRTPSVLPPSRLRYQVASSAAAATTTPSSSSSSRSPPPPRPVRTPHRRFFHRVFYRSQTPHSHTSLPRTPSPGHTPLLPATPPPSLESGLYQSAQASPINETRTRLPPPLEEPPVPYRPPGQRLFTFLQHP